MSNLHRLQWIDASIRYGRYPNTGDVANIFEISRRQALRDFDYLRDSLGAPVCYCAKHRGYYYTDNTFNLPSQLLTEEQRKQVYGLAGYYQAAAMADTRTAGTFTALAELLARLAGGSALPAKSNVDLPFSNKLIPFRALLRRSGLLANSSSFIPSSLQQFYRGQTDDQQFVMEFYDSHEFIPALLASGINYTITSPKWLREKLLAYVDRFRQSNIG